MVGAAAATVLLRHRSDIRRRNNRIRRSSRGSSFSSTRIVEERLSKEAPVAGGPIRSHATDTSRKPWAGPRMEKKLGDSPAKTLRKAYAWADPDGDPDAKASYKFIHHEVTADGQVAAANVKACTSGIGVLNGARGGSNVPAEDRKGIYNHLAKHLRDAGETPAPLK